MNPLLVDDQRLLRLPVARLMTCDPQVVSPSETLAQAARLMKRYRISAVPVCDQRGFNGLLSESLLLDVAIAGGSMEERAVGSVALPAAHAIGPAQPLFDALALMTRYATAHLPVIENGQLVGVLTQTDIVRQQTRSSVFLVMDIARAGTAESMAGSTGRIPQLLTALTDGGASPEQIGQVATSVAGAITRRLIELAEGQLGPAPVAYAWLACGSQGRREQLTVSDQDNCLVHADLPAGGDQRGAREWFERFAGLVCDGLHTAGYAYCPGDMMASNTRWRRSYSEWREAFRRWTAEGSTNARLSASVMADARCVSGDASLALALKQDFTDTVSAHRAFCTHLLGDALSNRPGLNAFGRLASDRDATGRERLDLKRGGTGPIVDLARVHALASGTSETGTLSRLDAAQGERGLSAASARDLADAYRYLAALRVRHAGQPVATADRSTSDHRIYLDTLSSLERNQLRVALMLVRDTRTMLLRRVSSSGF